MAPIAADMSAKLGTDVRLIKDYLDGGFEVAGGEVVLLENVRFNAGEKKDDETLSKKYAALCDVFVMDAFGTAHRAQASTEGIVRTPLRQSRPRRMNSGGSFATSDSLPGGDWAAHFAVKIIAAAPHKRLI